MATTFQTTHEPFLKHLNVDRTPHVIATAEDDDFDEIILDQLRSEGFNVQYVPMGADKGVRYADRIHAVANRMTGVSEHYAIVAYGDAAAEVLDTHTKASPRLCALIAYYPSTIPDPSRTSFPMATSLLVHLAGGEIGVRRTPEILGVQGKRKTVRKRVDRGLGIGGEMKLSFPSYKYEGVEPGFAEHDLEDYDAIAEDLAWTRTLRTLREAFGMRVDIERLRDQHAVDIRKNISKALEATSARAKVLYTPTMTGAISPKDLHRFYTEFFEPSPTDLNARLLSRTVGTDRVVDELALSFKHDRSIPWLLPGIPATNKQVHVTLISIVCIKGGLLAHEHVYWDQASVLLQVGLLDPRNISKKFKDQGVEELPVCGSESARAVTTGAPKDLNGLIGDW